MRHQRISIVLSFALLCSLLLSACNRYLEVTPKGYTLLNTVSDYDQWLNDPSLNDMNASLSLVYASDLHDIPLIPDPPTTSVQLSYVWSPDYAGNSEPDLWGAHYTAISSYNSVIVGVDDASGGTDAQKRALKAEALLGRALEYFYLVNEYGKPYDSATAAQDPAVPIVITDDVAQTVPARSPVKDVYDFIIADIQAAILHLPADNSRNRFRGSVAAAYSLLARVYLYAGNYAKARENAQLALENSTGQTVINYNNFTTSSEMQPLAIRRDAIYARNVNWGAIPTVTFLRSFNKQDSRLRLFYMYTGDLTFPNRGTTAYTFGLYPLRENAGTSIQEMKLIIAEAAARGNELTEALKQLDDVRKNRIAAASYVPYQSADKEFVLQKVLEERLFEFPYNSLRFIDMRRLDREGRMPAVMRYNAVGVVIATLEPHSPRYTLRVPASVMQFNPGMVQNP